MTFRCFIEDENLNLLEESILRISGWWFLFILHLEELGDLRLEANEASLRDMKHLSA